MGVIANLYPDIQDHEEYQRIQAELDEEAYPVHVENGEAMFEGADTGVVMIQYGDVEIPDDRDGELFGFLPPSGDAIVEDQVRSVTADADLPDGAEVTVTGSPVFEQAAFGLMLPEMIELFTIALFVIVVLVVAVMSGRLRRTRRIALPLSTALIALFAMLGMMGFVGFEFNAIMLGVMPVALGLGIDYGLQIQTRYVEERTAGRSPVESATIAARTTGRALALALGTTTVGLGSLLVAEVPPVRQFGVTAAFSVFTAMVLSLTLLIALLVTFDDRETGTPAEEPHAGADRPGLSQSRSDGGQAPAPEHGSSAAESDTDGLTRGSVRSTQRRRNRTPGPGHAARHGSGRRRSRRVSRRRHSNGHARLLAGHRGASGHSGARVRRPDPERQLRDRRDRRRVHSRDVRRHPAVPTRPRTP